MSTISYSNYGDLVKQYASSDILLDDAYGDDVLISENGNAKFVTVNATNLSGTLTTAVQPNITSLGTLSALTVSGDLNATIKTASQPNITSLGTLGGLSMGGNLALNNNDINSVGTLNAATVSATTSMSAPIVNATSRFIPPALTTSQRNALTSVANGTTVYDTTLNVYMVYNTTLSRWMNVGANSSVIDLTGGFTVSYYPVLLYNSGASSYQLDTITFEVSSSSGVSAMNNNLLHGSATGGGWSDVSPTFDVYFSQFASELTEDAILGIYRGTQAYEGICLYLAGGVSYIIRSNADTVSVGPMLSGTSTRTILDSTFGTKDINGADVGAIPSVNISQMVSLVNNGNALAANIGRHIYNSLNVYTPGTTTPTIRLNPTSSSQLPLLGVANTPSTANGTVLDVFGNLRVRSNIFIHAFDALDRGIFFRGDTATNAFEAGGVSRWNLGITTYDDGGGGSPDGLSINGYDGVRILTDNSTTPKFRIPRTGGVFIGGNQLCDSTGTITAARLDTGATANSWVVNRVAAGTTALQIGAYALCIIRTLNEGVIAGNTYSGALLSQGYTLNLNGSTSGGWYPTFTGSTMSGTWRAMNDSNPIGSGSWQYGGLFLRII